MLLHLVAPTLVVVSLLPLSCAPKQGDIIVARVGDNPITMREYENLYIKSNGSRDLAANATQDEREKFLDLMTKFKLKLADAYRQGLDKSPAIINEIDQYKGSLAASYLTEREVTAPGVRQLFERRGYEIRASHILITLKPNATPAESLAAYAQAYMIIGKLKAGADFGTLAMENSQDPSAKQNKGDLYYFTSGQMVSEFEDAVFAMKPGEISAVPVRTRYGVHIIKVTDRKPAPGEVKCSHIMIRFDKQDPSPEDTLVAYGKIKAIQDSISMGVDFADLAIRNSQDPGSASRGGDLGWFARRRWVIPFDEVAFNLKQDKVSGIVRTVYGYHIIKCYDVRPPKTFEEVKKDIQQLYQQTRFQDDYKRFLERLNHETRFMMNDSLTARFIAACDSTKSARDTLAFAGISPAFGSSRVMAAGKASLTVDSIVSIMKTRPDLMTTPLQAAIIRSALDKIAEQFVFAVKGEEVESTQPEFAALMKEYRDGILLYQIEQERVWGRIAVNDSILRSYFNENRQKFVYPDRVEFSEIHPATDSIAHVIQGQLKGGRSFEQLAMADSLRMAAPTTLHLSFAPGSSQVPSAAAKMFASLAAELKSDGAIKLQLTAYIDTTRNKGQNTKLAIRRFETVRKHLATKHGIASERITTISFPASSGSSDKRNREIDIEIMGRKAALLGKVVTSVLPTNNDERTKIADSLSLGASSNPFQYKGGVCIVRLDRREPSRLKTFEEASPEVSSSFQDFESKRLETQWLNGLRKSYPVTEYKNELKNAFGPVQ